MKFFYSGATKYNDPQPDATKSLGGYLSSSLIPNDLFGALFSTVSKNMIEKQTKEVRGIILKNDDPTFDAQNIFIWFDVPLLSQCKYRVAIVNLGVDNCGYFMERIINGQSLPYTATFYSANGIGNKINIGNLIKGGYFGIWLERTIDVPNITTIFDYNTLYTNYKNNIAIPVVENISFQMDWINV